MDQQEMDTQPQGPSETVKDNKTLKKEKKDLKDQLAIERSLLAMDRTLLAMVRTGTTFMTFGFAIYKLMQEKAKQPGEHPIVDRFTPKFVALLLFGTGLTGLVLQIVSIYKIRKKLQLDNQNFWWSPAVILCYVIIAVLVVLITGVSMSAN